MNKNGLLSLTAAAAVAIALGAMSGSAAAAPAKAKLLTATVSILDQQAPLLDDNGAPIVDPNTGLPETLDDTSVDIDATFLGDILAIIAPAPAPISPQLQAPAGATLTIGVEPAGFCAGLAAGGSSGASPDLKRAPETLPFVIPLAQIRQVKGLPVSEVFEGFAGRGDILRSAVAATPELTMPAGSSFESEGTDFFDGVPWANLTITPGVLILPGDLKLHGVTDLSSLLGGPKLTVDLALLVQAPTQLTSEAMKPSAAPGLICITVPATVTIESLPGVGQNRL